MFFIYKTPSLHSGFRQFASHSLVFPIIALFDVCFKQFKQDILSFVEDGILRSVAAQIQRNNNAHNDITKRRLKACKAWTASLYPFSLDKETVVNLILALNRTDDVRGFLPITDDLPPLTLKGFAQTTILVARTQTTQVSFPFLSKSPSVSLLRVAFSIASSHLASLSETARLAMISQAISIAVNEARFNHLPAPPPRAPGARGPPATKPVYSSWISFDDVRPEIAAITHTIVHQSNNPHAITALSVKDNTAISSIGQWNIAAVSLKDIPAYINKSVNPADIDIAHASLDTYNNANSDGYYVFQHYLWLMGILNIKSPVHRLVIWMARIFAALGPNLAPDPTHHIPECSSIDQAIAATQATPLLEPPNRKGLKQIRPIVVLFVGMAIGLIDPRSPISKHILEHSARESLGTPWTSKHGMSHSSSYPLLDSF